MIGKERGGVYQSKKTKVGAPAARMNREQEPRVQPTKEMPISHYQLV